MLGLFFTYKGFEFSTISEKLRPMYGIMKISINCITISLSKWIKIKILAKVTSLCAIMKAFVHVRRCVITT